MRMPTDDVPSPLERWLVCTEDDQRYILDYAGNGVSVRSTCGATAS